MRRRYAWATACATSTVGQIGLGAAGTGIVRLLRAYGVKHILGTDRNPAAVAALEAMAVRARHLSPSCSAPTS
jgi:malate dehydrogenase (oxaloacetate-decarboxylating)